MRSMTTFGADVCGGMLEVDVDTCEPLAVSPDTGLLEVLTEGKDIVADATCPFGTLLDPAKSRPCEFSAKEKSPPASKITTAKTAR